MVCYCCPTLTSFCYIYTWHWRCVCANIWAMGWCLKSTNPLSIVHLNSQPWGQGAARHPGLHRGIPLGHQRGAIMVEVLGKWICPTMGEGPQCVFGRRRFWGKFQKMCDNRRWQTNPDFSQTARYFSREREKTLRERAFREREREGEEKLWENENLERERALRERERTLRERALRERKAWMSLRERERERGRTLRGKKGLVRDREGNLERERALRERQPWEAASMRCLEGNKGSHLKNMCFAHDWAHRCA